MHAATVDERRCSVSVVPSRHDAKSRVKFILPSENERASAQAPIHERKREAVRRARFARSAACVRFPLFIRVRHCDGSPWLWSSSCAGKMVQVQMR
jgi:hypothetical protein